MIAQPSVHTLPLAVGVRVGRNPRLRRRGYPSRPFGCRGGRCAALVKPLLYGPPQRRRFQGMKIVFDVSPVASPLTGIGRYALELAWALEDQPEVERLYYFDRVRWVKRPDARIVAETLAEGGPQTARKASLVHRLRRFATTVPFAPLAFAAYRKLLQLKFSNAAPVRNADLYHGTGYMPLPLALPGVITVHDLSFIRYPQFHPAERVRMLRDSLPGTLDMAAAIITDAAAIREEVIATYGVSPERVHAVALGVGPEFHPRAGSELQPVLAAHGLGSIAYLLSVATLEPRKNLVGLVDAYSRLPHALRAQHPLVLVGSKGWLNEALEKRLAPLERAGEVRRLGYVAQSDLPHLYAGAWAFAYPSYYEGFGLPVVEAMASGIPTLTSNRSSLPEVAGTAAVQIDPEDPDALLRGLHQLLEDTGLRARLTQEGPLQAARFTWANTARKTLRVYAAALAG